MRSNLRDMSQKLTFVPAGRRFREWQDPCALPRLTCLYFDPGFFPSAGSGFGKAEPDARLISPAVAWQTALFTLNFALRPLDHGAHARACLLGIWHGVTGNIAARY